jgi:hypothetical protein
MPKVSRSRKFLAFSDNHGDQQDDETVAALLAFKEDFKPDICNHLGDCWDFRNLRRGATDDEKAGSLLDDWDAGVEFLEQMFGGVKENHFLLGNHDDRMWQFARSATGLLRDYANDGIKRIEAKAKQLNARLYPYDSALGICKVGHLSMVHGYHAGSSGVRQHANVYGNVIMGHVHTQESCAVASLVPAEAKSIGCLCKRDMDYINAKTGKLRWAQGWAYGYTFQDGTYQLYLTRKIDGKFTCATGMKQY